MSKASWFELLIEDEEKGIKNLAYVLKTLEIFEEYAMQLEEYREAVRKALQWCETAKGGSSERIVDEWYGINVKDHSKGSADIYRRYSSDDAVLKHRVANLIEGHCIIMQYLMGEASLNRMKEFSSFIKSELNIPGTTTLYQREKRRKEILRAVEVLYACAMRGRSEKAWEVNEKRIHDVINMLADEDDYWMFDYTQKRMKILKPDFSIRLSDDMRKNLQGICFWYPKNVFCAIDDKHIVKILNYMMEKSEMHDKRCYSKTTDYEFLMIDDFIFHNIAGERVINQFAKRILEIAIDNPGKHASLSYGMNDGMCDVFVRMDDATKGLLDFCTIACQKNDMKREEAMSMIEKFVGGNCDGDFIEI